jgi:arginyl-tRNA synthetase
MIQEKIRQLIETTIIKLKQDGQLPGLDTDAVVPVNIEQTRDRKHGDFATNVAMMLAAKVKNKPIVLAEMVVAALPHVAYIKEIKIAAPGFINFHLTTEAFHELVKAILQDGERYGHSEIGKGKYVMVEFMSANPTGPLHVGHGRNAAFGSTVSNLLATQGFRVHREYYVNDAGRQMGVLALSVWLRYLELIGDGCHFPSGGYKGEYIIDIARHLYQEHGKRFHRSVAELYQELPVDRDLCGDSDFFVDALLLRARQLLGESEYKIIFDVTANSILGDIKEDLEAFGVVYDEWFRESNLILNHEVEAGIEKLRANGYVDECNGALWFRSTAFGDAKDRVLVRANGEATYFASDVAYHLNKYARGFDIMINVWGSDHHGYIPRMKGFLQALSLDANKVTVLLVQFAILYRNKQKISMSTRSGEFVTLRQLREEVGTDVARFFYIMRKNDQHLDFDLDLAKSQSLDNPVYYIQYAYARVCSVMRQMEDKQLHYNTADGLASLSLLDADAEKELFSLLMRYALVLQHSAVRYEPHVLANYLRDLAGSFHAYYNACQFLVDDVHLRNARLCLIGAVKQIIANGLNLLGVSCPEAM